MCSLCNKQSFLDERTNNPHVKPPPVAFYRGRRADLPSPDTQRWVIRRKAIIAAAVRGGLITLDAACSRYRLNPEELLSWHYYLDRYGFSALRITKLQHYVRPGQQRCGPSCSEL